MVLSRMLLIPLAVKHFGCTRVVSWQLRYTLPSNECRRRLSVNPERRSRHPVVVVGCIALLLVVVEALVKDTIKFWFEQTRPPVVNVLGGK